MLESNRTHNAIKNIVVAYIGIVIKLVLKFCVRTMFVITLSKEYLGLEGLFSNILVFLSLAECGIGPAITFCLYKPIANSDERAMIALMSFFKKAYRIIGSFIFVLGIMFVPFIDTVIKGDIKIPDLRLIYILFLMNSVISYFFSYKAIFITANQKDYIVRCVQLIVECVKAALQMAILYCTKNYLLFLGVMIVSTLLQNVVIEIIANRRYPILGCDEEIELDANNKYLIKENVCAIVVHRIGGMVVFSSSHILMSKMCGLIAEALYSNYAMIISVVESFYRVFFQSITASVGNLRATSDISQQKIIFNKVLFVNFVGSMFAATCLLSLLNPFIKIWLGESFCFAEDSVVVLVLYFYLKSMRQTAMAFANAYGFQRLYKIAPIPEIIINLSVAIFGAIQCGPVGIFYGGIASILFVSVWVEPYVVYKHGFHMGLLDYFERYVKYGVVSFAVAVSAYYTCSAFTMGGILGILERLIICVSVTGMAVYGFFSRTDEFSDLLALGKKILRMR